MPFNFFKSFKKLSAPPAKEQATKHLDFLKEFPCFINIGSASSIREKIKREAIEEAVKNHASAIEKVQNHIRHAASEGLGGCNVTFNNKEYNGYLINRLVEYLELLGYTIVIGYSVEYGVCRTIITIYWETKK